MKKKYMHGLSLFCSILPFVSHASTPACTKNCTETIVFMRHGEKPNDDLGQLICPGLNRALALPAKLQAKYGITNVDSSTTPTRATVTIYNRTSKNIPIYTFAPNPAVQNPQPVDAKTPSYFYVRPLTTIEPTAIHFVLPVNTEYSYIDVNGTSDCGSNCIQYQQPSHSPQPPYVAPTPGFLTTSFNSDNGLVGELLNKNQKQYQNSLIFIAWDHGYIPSIASTIVSAYKGNAAEIKAWPGSPKGACINSQYDPLFDTLYIVNILTDENGKQTATFTQDCEQIHPSTSCPSPS